MKLIQNMVILNCLGKIALLETVGHKNILVINI